MPHGGATHANNENNCFRLGLRLRSQFGQRAKVMAKDLEHIALTPRRNRHPCLPTGRLALTLA